MLPRFPVKTALVGFLLLVALAGTVTPALAQYIPTPGVACNPNGNASFYEQSGICVSGAWQRPAFQFGAVTSGNATCAAGTAGIVQWTGSALQVCDGTSWAGVGGSSGNLLGTTASAANPQRSGDATTGLVSLAAGTVGIVGSGTETLRVTATSVGIGTTSPTHALEVNGDIGFGANVIFGTYHKGSSFGSYGYQNSSTAIQTQTGYDIVFGIGGSEKARIDSSGNVGIGTTTVNATLDVNGYAKLKINSAAPVACGATYKGSIAYTGTTTNYLCFCDGTSWKQAHSPATACTW